MARAGVARVAVDLVNSITDDLMRWIARAHPSLA